MFLKQNNTYNLFNRISWSLPYKSLKGVRQTDSRLKISCTLQCRNNFQHFLEKEISKYQEGICDNCCKLTAKHTLALSYLNSGHETIYKSCLTVTLIFLRCGQIILTIFLPYAIYRINLTQHNQSQLITLLLKNSD